MAIEAGEIETPDVPHDMNVLLRYVITRDGAVYAAPKEGDTSMPDQHKDIARTYGISVDDIVGSGSIYVSPGETDYYSWTDDGSYNDPEMDLLYGILGLITLLFLISIPLVLVK